MASKTTWHLVSRKGIWSFVPTSPVKEHENFLFLFIHFFYWRLWTAKSGESCWNTSWNGAPTGANAQCINQADWIRKETLCFQDSIKKRLISVFLFLFTLRASKRHVPSAPVPSLYIDCLGAGGVLNAALVCLWVLSGNGAMCRRLYKPGDSAKACHPR